MSPKEISESVIDGRRSKYQSQNELQSFSKPRAYVILQELEQENILEHIPRKGFQLTTEGRRIINELLHRTKLLETYFYQELGLNLDNSICKEFEKKNKHKNYLFSNGIDFLYEVFYLESKMKNNFLSNTIKVFGKNKSLNKIIKKFADSGLVL